MMKAFASAVVVSAVVGGFWFFVGFQSGKRVGAYWECRKQFTTVDTAPAVWEHCNRRFGIRPLPTGGKSA